MTFSNRTAWDTQESEWARALAERRRAGKPILDLTASNPTRCGFSYDAAALLEPLVHPAVLNYEPDPRGLLRARTAVTNYYRGHNALVDPEQIFLTTSTSEAYSFVFRLLCDPGDEVLIAQPSYPLFDFLAVLEDVRLVPYSLFYDYGWHLDIAALVERITPRTRAIALVHPNNPTGHFTKPAEREALEAVCLEHGLALIVDEVFLDYNLAEAEQQGDQGRSFACGGHPVLTFVLSGLSKIAALPQMKAAWMACFGPSEPLREASARLEIIADTFLSMNAPVQCALPSWLATSGGMQQQILQRVSGNLAALDHILSMVPLITRLKVEAGSYAVLRIPAVQNDEVTALQLLLKHAVAIHPGHFFGLQTSGWLVTSLLTPTEEFQQGIRAITSYFNDLDSNPQSSYSC